MRNSNRGIGLGIALALAGCEGAPIGGGTASQAQDITVLLSSQTQSEAHFRLAAVDDNSGSVALERSVSVAAGATTRLALTLPAAAYTFKATAYSDAAETIAIGESEGKALVSAAEQTEVKLVVEADGQGGAGKLTVTTHVAPKITAVQLSLADNGDAAVHVSATSADGSALHFYYSGFGVQGTVAGSADLTLSAMAAAAQGKGGALAIVVADDSGSAANARIDFGVSPASAFGAAQISINGVVQGGGDGAGGSLEGSASASACLDAHASCTASCDAAAHASPAGLTAAAACAAQCAVQLAACNSH